jgi:hypothetical protein
MKHCKSCKKEIDSDATKCPYCRAYQDWYRNPQILGMIVSLGFVVVMFHYAGIWGQRDFHDFRTEFSVKKVSEALVEGKPSMTFEITNNTNHRWSNLEYALVYTDKGGKVLNAESGISYGWSVEPRSSRHVSVPAPKVENAEKIDFAISRLRTGRWAF